MILHCKSTLLLCLLAVSSYAFAFHEQTAGKGGAVAFSQRSSSSSLSSPLFHGSTKNTVLRVSAGGSSVLPPPALKTPPEMYQAAVATGTMKGKSSVQKIFILGLAAACHIGFGAYLALSVAGACPGIMAENPGLQKFLLGAVGLPSGLIMTLVTGAELFTGNTALVFAARQEGKVTTSELLKSWSVSYIANVSGSIALAWLCFQSGTMPASAPAAVNVAVAKCSMTFPVAFLRGILGNWMVCMAIYIANGCSTMEGKMTSVWFLISAFVAMGFDHSVANMFFIPLGIFRGASISWMEMWTKNLIPVTLGNIVGGALCVMAPYGTTFGNWLKKDD